MGIGWNRRIYYREGEEHVMFECEEHEKVGGHVYVM